MFDQIIDLLKKHRSADILIIRSITPMTGGFLVAARWEWYERSIREDVVWFNVPEHGRDKGIPDIGFTHKIHEFVHDL